MLMFTFSIGCPWTTVQEKYAELVLGIIVSQCFLGLQFNSYSLYILHVILHSKHNLHNCSGRQMIHDHNSRNKFHLDFTKVYFVKFLHRLPESAILSDNISFKT